MKSPLPQHHYRKRFVEYIEGIIEQSDTTSKGTFYLPTILPRGDYLRLLVEQGILSLLPRYEQNDTRRLLGYAGSSISLYRVDTGKAEKLKRNVLSGAVRFRMNYNGRKRLRMEAIK